MRGDDGAWEYRETTEGVSVVVSLTVTPYVQKRGPGEVLVTGVQVDAQDGLRPEGYGVIPALLERAVSAVASHPLAEGRWRSMFADPLASMPRAFIEDRRGKGPRTPRDYAELAHHFVGLPPHRQAVAPRAWAELYGGSEKTWRNHLTRLREQMLDYVAGEWVLSEDCFLLLYATDSDDTFEGLTRQDTLEIEAADLRAERERKRELQRRIERALLNMDNEVNQVVLEGKLLSPEQSRKFIRAEYGAVVDRSSPKYPRVAWGRSARNRSGAQWRFAGDA